MPEVLDSLTGTVKRVRQTGGGQEGRSKLTSIVFEPKMNDGDTEQRQLSKSAAHPGHVTASNTISGTVSRLARGHEHLIDLCSS